MMCRLMSDKASFSTIVELWFTVSLFISPTLPQQKAICPFETFAIKTIYYSILHLFMQQVLIILQTDGYTEGGRAR